MAPDLMAPDLMAPDLNGPDRPLYASSAVTTPVALTIAGSDSSGGAGQSRADLKTFRRARRLWRLRDHGR